MTEPLVVVMGRGQPYFVERFLRRYPEVVTALQAAGAYVVVFGPDHDLEALEEDREPSAESLVRRTRLALTEAEHALPPRPGVPLFVAAATGCYFYEVVAGEGALLAGLRASCGFLLGYMELGEGGATFYAPDGRDCGWEAARELVMGQIAALAGDRAAVGGGLSPSSGPDRSL